MNCKYKISLALSFTLWLTSAIQAQNIVYARYVLDTLCSKTMWGRACNNDGIKLAADFLSKEFQKAGLQEFSPGYRQSYPLQSNTIDKVSLAIGHPDSLLRPGIDYIVFGSSPSVDIRIKDHKPIYIKSVQEFEKYKLAQLEDRVVVFDGTAFNDSQIGRKIYSALEKAGVTPKLVIAQGCDRNLTFPIGRTKSAFPMVTLRNNLIKGNKTSLYLSVTSTLHEQYQADNIVGYVKGKVQPDTFFVFIAHYDHLGAMGQDVYFPGANDNASSISVLLDLAHHYGHPAHQPDYSILFLAVSGEEIGLCGSRYYAEYPFFPLSQMKFLINMDMNGTGSGGFHLVNGDNEPKATALIRKINAEKYYFMRIASGGGGCNSDHCAFYQQGVPSLFVFTSGCEYNEYHSAYDKPANMPFTKYESVFRMLTDFVERYR